MTQYKTQYGTVFAVKEHNGSPAIMCRAEISETWSLSSMITPFTPGAWTAEELQGQLDNWAATKGWQPVAEPASREAPEIVDECSESEEECPYLHPLENSKKYSWQCALCGDKFVNREICNKSFRSCGWYLDRHEKDSQQDDEAETTPTDFCQCRTCEQESCFAHGCTKECPANAEESCLTTSCPEYREKPQVTANPTHAAPDSPAVAGAATQSLSAAGSASLAAEPAEAPAFDYSGLDVPTRDALHWAEKEIGEARRDYIARLAQAVAIAHDALCATVVQNLDNGKFTKSEESFQRWCESVGIKRSTAYNLLQVQTLLSGATPEEQATLEAASPSLLYAAAKPSAPAELVQAVKDGDITTHKQYQDLLAKLKAEQTARAEAEQALATEKQSGAGTSALLADEQQRRQQANEARIAAENRAAAAESRARAAEKERDEACKERDGAKSALQASKLRGDRLKAENDDLKARPIEVPVVDEEEIDRRARIKADELTAPLREELETLRSQQPADFEEAEQAIQNAYDGTLYAGRTMENAWNALRPLLACMDASRRRLAIQQLRNTLSKIQGEIELCL